MWIETVLGGWKCGVGLYTVIVAGFEILSQRCGGREISALPYWAMHAPRKRSEVLE